jgi:hypothetical protein
MTTTLLGIPTGMRDSKTLFTDDDEGSCQEQVSMLFSSFGRVVTRMHKLRATLRA